MTDGRVRTAWYLNQVEKEANKDVLSMPERIGQIVGAVAICIFLVFFIVHQTRSTGFFTSDFGGLEAALFYSSGAFGLVPTFVRLFTGRKNPARFFDGIGSALGFVVVLYLLAVFPFDFAFIAEPLPGGIQFLLDWISNGLAKIVMALAVVVTAIVTPYTFMLYYGVRRRLRLPVPEETPGTSEEI